MSEGKVYDHIRFRARGGVWRYAMGKNMWKFEFNKGQPFAARDDFGRPYQIPWSKVNLRACIQQGDYGERGEQGMFESVGFRLFNLAGVEAPNTHWIQLRIIDGREENPADQYQGDFWGLYLAIENEDGHFLKEHGLPDGNLYKMEGSGGALSNHGAGAVTNQADLDRFIAAYSSPRQTEEWWRANVDLPRYYSYRSILECIHHYDVAEGKNYDYYLHPQTGKWIVIPWDIDLTWADHMYGSGAEPFKRRVLAHANLRHEYQNRLREIRDLLFNPDQAWQLIEECAAIIADPSGAPSLVDADRVKWDYHPAMANGGKSGQGLFYEASPTKDFAGMVRTMKDYVKTRGAWIDLVTLRLPPVGALDGDAGPPARRDRSASLRSPLGGDLAQEGVGGRLLAQRRQPHVAREDLGLRGQRLQQLGDRVGERRPVAAGQVGAADRPLEDHVAREHRLLVGDRVGDVPGAVAGDEVDVDLQARERQVLAAGDRLVGVVALERAEAGPGDVGHDVGQDGDLDLRAVHGRAGGAGHGRHRPDVVEVAVGYEDRLDRDAERAGGRQQPLGLLAGIDHDRRDAGASLRGAGGAHDVAVLLHWPDGECAHVQVAHRVRRGRRSARGRSRRGAGRSSSPRPAPR